MSRKKQLAYFREQKTPFYFYDLDKLDQVLDALDHELKNYNFHLHYALKANTNPVVLNRMAHRGYGADCVSGGEVSAAVEHGFDKSRIVFAGVGKSDEEIEFALSENISSFNVESVAELKVIEELAQKHDKVAPICLRLNPDVDAKTHHYITTGLNENKFGIYSFDFEEIIEILKKSRHLKFIGLHFHIGSQITDLSAFKHLCLKANEFNTWFSERKLVPQLINVGGGLGVDYHNPEEKLIPDFANFFRIFHQFLELQKGQTVHFELGRAVVAQMGELITRALYIKKGLSKEFVIVDAGMTELIRPALYGAFHKIENLSNPSNAEEKYDVVGPICETSDSFGKQVPLPVTKRGDLLSIRSCGAYGEVMSCEYNLRKRARVVTSKEVGE